MTTTETVTVYDKASALAGCLCAQVAADGLPQLCFCGLIPGADVIQDYVTCQSKDERCGMAWTRVYVGAPVTGIGQQDESLNNCGADLGFDLEVGILRCVPVASDAQGNAPTEAQMLASARLQLLEMETMRRAIQCCDALEEFILNSYTPLGPSGGVAGGFWTVSTGLT